MTSLCRVCCLCVCYPSYVLNDNPEDVKAVSKHEWRVRGVINKCNFVYRVCYHRHGNGKYKGKCLVAI